jgi:hypothetical protein
MPVITIRSRSPVHDAALLALRDVADVGADVDGFRVIGGHMMALLLLLYHTASRPRLTVDADAGIDTEVAASGWMKNGLAQRGYTFQAGSYRRQTEAGAALVVDLVVPRTGRRREVVIGGYSFFASSGLGLALSLPPIWTDVTARLHSREALQFTVPVPDVEAAFILKINAWCQRLSETDLVDLAALLEIVHRDPSWLASPWRLDSKAGVRGGERRDAARLVHRHLLRVRSVPERIRVLAAQYVRDVN